MSIHHRVFVCDAVIRTAGLMCMALSMLAIRHLHMMIHTAPRHAAPLPELGLAAIGFLGASLGSALTFLGHHIFDQVEISARWARSDLARPSGRDIDQGR